MIYLIGHRTTEELVKQTANYTSAPPIKHILSNVSAEEGIPISGLHAYGVKDKATLDRIMARDSYDLVWRRVYDPQTSGTYNEIVDVDFSPQDNKLWVGIESDVTEITADGVDSATITLTVYQSDGVTPKTNVNKSQNLPVDTPKGRAQAKVTVANGSGTLNLSTTEYGYWTIPGTDAATRYPNLRFKDPVEILALLDM